MLHLGPIWYHSEPSGVPYSQNLPRPISWFGLFLQQNDSTKKLTAFTANQPKNIWHMFEKSPYRWSVVRAKGHSSLHTILQLQADLPSSIAKDFVQL